MSVAERTTVVVQEFTPEQAGEQIAWLDTKIVEREGAADISIASIAIARVAEEGAHLSFIVDEEGQKLTSRQTNRGFLDSTELSLVVDHETVRHTQILRGPGNIHYPTACDSKDDRFYQDDRIDIDKGEWVIGSRNIVRALKARLAAVRAGHAYDRAYYELSMISPGYALLADPTQHEKTESHRNAARSYVMGLEELLAGDIDMSRNLTVFGEIPANEIPEKFAAFRREVRTQELALGQLKSSVPFGDWFMPIGARPNGRTWPYMDPEQSDETVAFGRELSALEQREIGPAKYELDREVKELELRRTAALRVMSRLGVLATKESEAATDS